MSSPVYKLIILFQHPDEPAEFERRWSEEFVPLSERLPGLLKVVVSHTNGGPAGPVAFYLIHELHFSSMALLTAAMASPQGRLAGQCLLRLAGQKATLVFAEHMEDVPVPAHGMDDPE